MKIRVWEMVFLLVAAASAQMNPAQMNSPHLNSPQLNSAKTISCLRVRVEFANGVCDPETQVALMGQMGGIVAQGIPDSHCVFEFGEVREGNYQVIVSGRNFSQIDAGIINAAVEGAEQSVRVNVGGYSQSCARSPTPSVSVTELGVPARARKELAKANELIKKQQFGNALDRLNKIIAQYPTYATAYNNLAVVYAHQGNQEKERDALQHAISVDDHYAAPYVNLARLDIHTNDFVGAETLLNKASSLGPEDSITLVLLGFVQLQNRQFDKAIETANRAHSLPGEHAFTHQVAASAYEQKRDIANAISQLELFLKEEPTGAQADSAHKELSVLQAEQTPTVVAGRHQ